MKQIRVAAPFGEARTVAWAIPRMLCAVVFEGAAKVRTSGHGRCEKPNHRLKCVDGKLWVEKCA